MSEAYHVYEGDCLQAMEEVRNCSVDLCYLDPPFFTQKRHTSSTRDGAKTFSFDDVWSDQQEYAEFLFERLTRMRSCLKPTGSIFFHCDRAASHLARILLDGVFGAENFQSEIIWHFKRWSNSKKGLLPSHQTIFWYSKGESYKFNPSMQDYSPTTNVDQIMQKRGRDGRNKSVYATDGKGSVVMGGAKKGVPLSDVWEIPFLNPKAKERTGYPTQKPLVLLTRIVELVTDPGDVVLDPFCGSGTTLVAAQQADRKAIGIDISGEAVALTRERLSNPVVTESRLLKDGKEAYLQHDRFAAEHLSHVPYTPVHRSKGIDGLLKQEANGHPIFVRVQRPNETLDEAASLLLKATRKKGACVKVVIKTCDDLFGGRDPDDVIVIPAVSLQLEQEFSRHLEAAE